MIPRRLFRRAIFAASTSWICLACASPESPESAGTVDHVDTPDGFVVDDRGDTLFSVVPRERVVSMIPSITELLVEIGAVDRLAGRTRYDLDPTLSSLPSVGGGLDPDLETLLALRPDLVVLWPDTDLRGVGARLRELGIPTYAARIEGLDDFRRHARGIGSLVGGSASADSIVRAIDAELNRVIEVVADADRPSVLYVIGIDPPTVAGPGTFVDSLITAAGGTNVFADLSHNWPQVSLEEVVRRDPDFVALSVSADTPNRGAVDILRGAPGWSRVPAVIEGRSESFDPDLFNRPGPGIGDAVAALARWLHPQLDDLQDRSARRPEVVEPSPPGNR